MPIAPSQGVSSGFLPLSRPLSPAASLAIVIPGTPFFQVAPLSVDLATIARPCFGSGPVGPLAVYSAPPAYTVPSGPNVTHGALQYHNSGLAASTRAVRRTSITFESRKLLPPSVEMETWHSAVRDPFGAFVLIGSE